MSRRMSPGVLALMRKRIETTLPGTAVIETYSLSSDGMGGQTGIWTPSGTVDCALQAMTTAQRTEIQTGGQILSVSRWTAILPHGTSVTEKDRLAIGDYIYRIDFVDDGETWSTALRVELVSHGEEVAAAVTSDYSFDFSQAKNSFYLGFF